MVASGFSLTFTFGAVDGTLRSSFCLTYLWMPIHTTSTEQLVLQMQPLALLCAACFTSSSLLDIGQHVVPVRFVEPQNTERRVANWPHSKRRPEKYVHIQSSSHPFLPTSPLRVPADRAQSQSCRGRPPWVLKRNHCSRAGRRSASSRSKPLYSTADSLKRCLSQLVVAQSCARNSTALLFRA